MPGRILIVDDVATNRIVLKVRMLAASYDVIQAASLAEAEAAIATQSPTLLILSDRLAGVEAFCRGLREDPASADLGIIVLTAPDDDTSSRLAFLAAGADEVIVRPVPEGLLQAQVRSLLRRRPERHMLLASGLAEAPAIFDHPGRISLVSADQTALARLKRELAGRLRDPITAVAPQAVFDSLRTGPVPDVFVLACTGLSMNELRLLADLRARPETGEAAVLVMGGAMDAEFRIMALDLGATDVISDTCGTGELVLRIRARLRQKRESDRHRAAVERELKLAATDPLTGLANRRAADKRLAEIAERAAAEGVTYALMMLDLDRFKAINDTHGHGVGDEVLVEVAHRLAGNLREGDLVARVGGEEFLIALPDTPIVPARLAAERLRRVIEAEPVRLRGGEPLYVTLSIGLSIGQGPGDSVEQAIDRADRALYAAKAQGRNTVTVGRSVA